MKINRENIDNHLIDYQLGLIGKSIADAYKYPEDWFTRFTMTDEQHAQFKTYAIPLIKKVFKCNRKRAEHTFNWYNLDHGLRIDNSKTNDDENLQDLEL